MLFGIVEMELAGPQGIHDSIKDTKLTGREGTNHDATGRQTDRQQLGKTDFSRNVHQTRHHGSIATGPLLVDFTQESIGGMRNDRGRDTGNDTGQQGNAQGGGAADFGRCFSHTSVHAVSYGTLHDEFGASVRDLLGQDGSETRVETSNSFRGGHFLESIQQSRAEFGVRDGSDTDGLERTQEDIGNGFGSGRCSNVNSGLVFPSLLFSEGSSGLNLEVLDSTKFEPSLNKVSDGGSTETRRECGNTFFGNDCAETSDQSGVVLTRERKYRKW